MRFHWQNLNDSKRRPRRGGGARHGRAWLTLFHSPEPRTREEEKRIKYRPGISVNWEWAFFWRGAAHLSFKAQQGDGVGVQLAIAVPWVFSFYLTLQGGMFARLARKLLPDKDRDGWSGRISKCYSDREVDVSIHDWGIWWALWTDPMSWSSKTPKWRHGSWHPLDTFLGKAKYSERVIEAEKSILVPMPERAYAGTGRVLERVHKRPRWPFARRWVCVDLDMKRDPVPFPGKGENSWDCGEDASYGFGCAAETLEEGIGKFVASKLRDRGRNGGRGWTPTEDHRPKDARA